MDNKRGVQDTEMRPNDHTLAGELGQRLDHFHANKTPLPGFQEPAYRSALLEQIVESIRRIRYVTMLCQKNLSDGYADPSREMFDPLKAAIVHKRNGNIDEAFWLVFFFTHFGKKKGAGWRLARSVYGALDSPDHWTWHRTSADPDAFRHWLDKNQNVLKLCGGFGNHRKYESLNAWKANGTGEAFKTYVEWIGPTRDHAAFFSQASKITGGNARVTFDHLYASMHTVARFGRTGRFDYLTMIGKLGLAAIEPGSAFMQGATGPLSGARLLFGGGPNGELSAASLDQLLIELDAALELHFGMQVLEDALCNWQKSPAQFIPFRG